jgi:hypothetical protein
MGGRAVEGTGLENRQGRKLLVGSNPTPSAMTSKSSHNRWRVRTVAAMVEILQK